MRQLCNSFFDLSLMRHLWSWLFEGLLWVRCADGDTLVLSCGHRFPVFPCGDCRRIAAALPQAETLPPLANGGSSPTQKEPS
jgi:hypothetical protein